MTRFAIFAAPRTGSNLLCTLLNSHPEVLCHHEVFNPQGVFTALDYQGDTLSVQSIQQRDDDPLGFLERVWQSGSNHRCVGFKWTRGQDESVLQHVLADPSVSKMILRRRNRIKTFVSEKIAQLTNQWEVYTRDDLLVPRPRIVVDTRELLRHIASNEAFYARLMSPLAQPRQPYLELEYETLFDERVQRRMFAFLGVRASDFTPTAGSVKQNPTDLRDSIANFAEVADCLDDPVLLAELNDRGM